MLDTGGPDAVVLREAARSRVRWFWRGLQAFWLAHQLIVAAVVQATATARINHWPSRWRTGRSSTRLWASSFTFEPWEQNPRMLESFVMPFDALG